jgi:hypothetical protein
LYALDLPSDTLAIRLINQYIQSSLQIITKMSR